MPSRKPLVAALAGVAVAVAAGLGWYAFSGEKSVPPAPAAAVPAHAPPAPIAAETAATPVAPAAALPFRPVGALQEIVDGASSDRGVTVKTEKSQVNIGKDSLRFSVKASHDGYLYVQMVGSDSNNFYLLFPNAADKSNFIKAGQTLSLPRPGWHLTVEGPPGVDEFVAIVADSPRNFDNAGLTRGDLFSEFPIGRARELQRAYTGGAPLFAGVPACPKAGADCSALYGATRFSIEEVK